MKISSLILCCGLCLAVLADGCFISVNAADRGAKPARGQIQRHEQKVIDRISERAIERAKQRQLNRLSESVNANNQLMQHMKKLQDGKQLSAKHQHELAVLSKQHKIKIIQHQNQPTFIRMNEIFVQNASVESKTKMSSLGLIILETINMTSLPNPLEKYKVPADLDVESVVSQLRSGDPSGRYDFNFIYFSSGVTSESNANKDASVSQTSKSGFSIGMIDTGVDASHPSLKNVQTYQLNFGRGAEIKVRNHGTAIASLLAQEGANRIWVADIFSGDGGFSDSEAILKALGWLVRSEVGTINMSLTGPDDPLMKVVVESINQKGHVIVAAVGNLGPKGQPQYPAAYEDVIAVTAIDSNNKIYESANQGDYVDVAALGVDIIAASTQGTQTYSGTSFACPIVAANLAKVMTRPEKAIATDAKQLLFSQLTDLGAKGIDPTFGRGALLTH